MIKARPPQLFACVAVLMLAGCGNKGPLFLPADEQLVEELDTVTRQLDGAADASPADTPVDPLNGERPASKKR